MTEEDFKRRADAVVRIQDAQQRARTLTQELAERLCYERAHAVLGDVAPEWKLAELILQLAKEHGLHIRLVPTVVRRA